MTKEERKNYIQHRAIMDKHLTAMHVELGLFYRYPNCCIEQFCIEQMQGIASAEYRMAKHKMPIPNEFEYVPCDKCMRKIIRELK